VNGPESPGTSAPEPSGAAAPDAAVADAAGPYAAGADAIDAVIDALAQRLADPARTLVRGRDEPADRPSAADSALNGGAGLALLYAELGHHQREFRPVAHRYLALAGRSLPAATRHGLFAGAPALAFAAVCAMHRDGEYAKLLGDLDASVHRAVRGHLDAERARLRSGAVARHYLRYDVVSGLAGLGRYLLRRCPASAESESLLREILAYFGELVRPVEQGGRALPGWWSQERTPYDNDDGTGHANLGLAHGIPGPLALLASSWRAGVRTSGQSETVEAIAAFLTEWSDADEYGPYWPSSLNLRQYQRRSGPLPRARAAWCYGAPGVSRALQLAGLALGRTDWTELARAAARAVFRRPEPDLGLRDSCLCHGCAGLLHLTGRLAADDPHCGLGAETGRLALRTAAAFDPELPFGYRQFSNAQGAFHDDPGFLTGSAGVALALHAYRNGPRPASGWDSALLLD